MIQTQDILIAGKGKLLYYPAENIVWGKAVRLVTYKGHQLTVDDFSEIDETDVVDIGGVNYVFYNQKYVDIVGFVPPPHYTYDAQITLMLNYRGFPNQYQEKYNEMQEWKKFAKEVAKRFT